MEACLDTAQQMRRLTESLLELARYDANEDHPRGEVDLAETAGRCVGKITPLAKQHRIRIDTDFAPARALTNADRLSQVIVNLLTNAIYYNQAEGTVRISTRVEGDRAAIAVADTGIGISAADLPHIFDRFYRADKTRSRVEGHTGLGLAISKAIVEAEGGSIEVDSAAGAGATFTVRLPVR